MNLYKEARWKARSDLRFLCVDILGFKDVEHPVFNPLINHVQKFPVPPREQWGAYDTIERGKWKYTPFTPLYSLEGPRWRLILDSRGFLKTTINSIAHSIQWILNYPNINMIIFQSNDEKACEILRDIKKPFQVNQTFRDLFPEHCPQKRSLDWGTQNHFFTEARDLSHYSKEPTMVTGALEKGSAGRHFDVMKFSDIVEPNNTRTPQQLARVIYDFQMAENLLVRPDGWQDVEGTRYSYSDLYGLIVDTEVKRKKEGFPPRWSIYVRGCYKKDVKDPKFIPEELDLLDAKTEDGRPISWWPERWPWQLLEEKRMLNPGIFNSQQRNHPHDADSQIFPVDKEFPKKITREEFRKVPIAMHTVTVDTADTQNKRSNFTAITVCGWDQAGRAYIHDVRHGRYLPDEVIFHLFDVVAKYRPLSVKIEETAYVRGLMPSINRALETSELRYRNQIINVEGVNFIPDLLPRETTISKEERIQMTLQPWYRSGNLRFLEDLDCWEHLMHELSRFPFYEYNDIIDAVADQFQGREMFGRLMTSATTLDQFNTLTKNHEARANALWPKVQKEAMDKMFKLDGYDMPQPDDYWDRTGGL